MATMTITFRPTTTGIHKVGYKTFEDVDYNIIDVDVQEPMPALVNAVIPITANLYCADNGVDVDWYIIPECMDDTDSNNDGVPDLAISGTYTVQPVPEHWIKCKITIDRSVDLMTFACNGLLVLNGSQYVEPQTGNPDETFHIFAPDDLTVDPGSGITVDVIGDKYHCQSNYNVEISTDSINGHGVVAFYSAWDGSGAYTPGRLVVMDLSADNSHIQLENIIWHRVFKKDLDGNVTEVVS